MPSLDRRGARETAWNRSAFRDHSAGEEWFTSLLLRPSPRTRFDRSSEADQIRAMNRKSLSISASIGLCGLTVACGGGVTDPSHRDGSMDLSGWDEGALPSEEGGGAAPSQRHGGAVPIKPLLYDYEDTDPPGYVQYGTKWDHMNLTFAYANYSNDLSIVTQERLIRSAFDRWVAACNALSF